MITTVLGDVWPETLGHCQIHEHVWVSETPAAQKYPQLRMDRPDESLAELIAYRRAGGHALVDAQPVGAGRNVERLATFSKMSQVQIIAVTGFHRPMFYGEAHWIHQATVEQLTDLFSSEIETGAFSDGDAEFPQVRTIHRAGLVKAALGPGEMDDWTLRLLKAAGMAAVKTGSALMMHTEAGQSAVEAIKLLADLGLPAQRIIVCHVDRQSENLAPHLNIAKTGAYLDYDTIGRFKYHSDESEMTLIGHMITAGHLDQLMLSLDTTAERFKSYGGPIGLDYLLKTFLPRLVRQGISMQDCTRMMRNNPARVLARNT